VAIEAEEEVMEILEVGTDVEDDKLKILKNIYFNNNHNFFIYNFTVNSMKGKIERMLKIVLSIALLMGLYIFAPIDSESARALLSLI
jgi:hypothetical protein